MAKLPLRQPYSSASGQCARGLPTSRARRKMHIICRESAQHPAPEPLPTHFKKGLVNPRHLLNSSQGEATVWTVRMVTGKARGSALSEDAAGVQLCLIGQSGNAVLHRMSAHTDSASAMQDMLAILEAAGKMRLTRADQSSARKALRRLESSQAQSPAWAQGMRRFRQGAVDEISFLGAELGPLASLLVGPETGSWFVEEITVASSRSQHTDRFICRQPVGDRRGHGNAAFLRPVPAGMVVYGSGGSARIYSQTQARLLHAAGMKGYLHLKSQLLWSTASLVLGGSVGAYILDSWHSAVPFALGGLGGVAYQWKLQQGTDALLGGRLPGQVPMQALAPGALLRRATSTPFSSTLLFIAAMLAAYAYVMATDSKDVFVPDRVPPAAAAFPLYYADGAHHLMLAALGFLMFKLAVMGVALMPVTSRPPPAELDKTKS